MAKNIDYTKRVTRQITFPSRLMDIAESKARTIGYTFPEYVRYVLTKELEDFYLSSEEYLEDPMLEKGIGVALQEARDGKTKSFKNREEFVDYFSKVIDGEK